LKAGKLEGYEALKLRGHNSWEAIFKKIEPRRREEREGILYESGTPAGRALAGVTIRTEGRQLR